MAKLNPYLNFSGMQCREAMNFYRECLGGELTLQQVSEMPEMAAMMPPEYKDHIIHATLVSGDMVLMASDLVRGEPVQGNMGSVIINCDDEAQITAFFEKLAAGGKVIQPLADMPWGARYGELTDKFGKDWSLNWQRG
ncbi:MAG: VOC family protein [Flavipsychrobacter sp.]|nr:VOC family protein [Flavipsychrobacter sp.]